MVLRNDGGMSQKVGLVPEPRSSMGQQAGSTQRLPIGRAMALLAAQDAGEGAGRVHVAHVERQAGFLGERDGREVHHLEVA